MTLSLGKPLGTIVLILLVYDLSVAWVWHQIGFHDGQFGVLFGLLTLIISKIGFPLLFLTMVYKRRPKMVGGLLVHIQFVGSHSL